ncbi:LysM peptidoglycan-binding domain-containing protein [Streptomyces griseoviridis]|uniref:LysM peptidoglycan-binding domain-containing protein n=1 Tax=Streptomyces griseoviridis TaxID=45398 RepID=A0A3Q9KT30_STRGD|nr:M23 family metallopeptidase [Streptomyces griseoviridis]AZS83764.1 LysM peptidoglycan-binding domain-containing protein [Streptomyces griseoviridis]QCN89383.1 peptidase [Streptomyces griseoviridis]
MPAKGKHRRPKALRLTRSIAVAGTGGAALALPLMGAAGAHAATPQSVSQSVSEKAVASAPAAGAKSATAEKSSATTRTYSVRVGDYLSKIADEQKVSGGWQRLYSDNRQAVGGDPSLIHPGLKLTIGAKAATTADQSSNKSSDAPSSAGSSDAAGSTGSTGSTGSSSASTAQSSSGSSDSSAATVSTGFTLPVSGASVGTSYRASGSMWSSGYHTGVDFVVPTGTALKAVGAGSVVSAGWGGAYGNQVVIQLADGRYAQYAHLSQLSVSTGQSVTAGQQIGLSGATGNVTGPHLHFEIRTTPDYGSDVDPLAYLRAKGVTVG